ncbi:MAG: hypothetical protein J0L69_15370 [Bacteroidetes bacterium]|nr:hypothetical protein [Bacteroidota bacterium]
MENQHTKIQASVIDANKQNSLKDKAVAILALGAAVAVVATLCLGCINTANELINMFYE